jgi:hypothetical protein
MSQIYVTKGGINHGPFSVSVLNEKLQGGEFTITDMAWMEGVDGWLLLDDDTFSRVGVKCPAPKNPPPPLPPEPLPSGQAVSGEVSSAEQGTGELAKALAGNLLKRGKQAVEKVASSEGAKNLKKKATELKGKLKQS